MRRTAIKFLLYGFVFLSARVRKELTLVAAAGGASMYIVERCIEDALCMILHLSHHDFIA